MSMSACLGFQNLEIHVNSQRDSLEKPHWICYWTQYWTNDTNELLQLKYIEWISSSHDNCDDHQVKPDDQSDAGRDLRGKAQIR